MRFYQRTTTQNFIKHGVSIPFDKDEQLTNVHAWFLFLSNLIILKKKSLSSYPEALDKFHIYLKKNIFFRYWPEKLEQIWNIPDIDSLESTFFVNFSIDDSPEFNAFLSKLIHDFYDHKDQFTDIKLNIWQSEFSHLETIEDKFKEAEMLYTTLFERVDDFFQMHQQAFVIFIVLNDLISSDISLALSLMPSNIVMIDRFSHTHEWFLPYEGSPYLCCVYDDCSETKVLSFTEF